MLRAAILAAALALPLGAAAQSMTLSQLQAYVAKLANRVIATDAKVAAQQKTIEALEADVSALHAWAVSIDAYMRDATCKWNLLQNDLAVRLSPDAPTPPAAFEPKHVTCDGSGPAPTMPVIPVRK